VAPPRGARAPQPGPGRDRGLHRGQLPGCPAPVPGGRAREVHRDPRGRRTPAERRDQFGGRAGGAGAGAAHRDPVAGPAGRRAGGRAGGVGRAGSAAVLHPRAPGPQPAPGRGGGAPDPGRAPAAVPQLPRPALAPRGLAQPLRDPSGHVRRHDGGAGARLLRPPGAGHPRGAGRRAPGHPRGAAQRAGALAARPAPPPAPAGEAPAGGHPGPRPAREAARPRAGDRARPERRRPPGVAGGGGAARRAAGPGHARGLGRGHRRHARPGEGAVRAQRAGHRREARSAPTGATPTPATPTRCASWAASRRTWRAATSP